jgi:hypothetical protein
MPAIVQPFDRPGVVPLQNDAVISERERNRALLARQLLLERVPMPPLQAIEHLVGMQAQTPRSPYTALWSRLAGFDPMTLSRAIETRQAVRIALMRSTIHLVSAGDAVLLRPLTQPIVMRELTAPVWRRQLQGIDFDALGAKARELLEDEPRTPKQLGAALAQDFPDHEPRALAHAARSLLPLVQIPPRGLWDRSGATTLTTAEHWLGMPMTADARWDDAALRYLGAFGPATAADLVTWSRIPGFTEVIDRLRPQLLVLHDEDGRELFDLPDAPRPPADTPAPPRFLPDYDNLLLGHADRSFVFAKDIRTQLQTSNGVLPGTVLVDGRVAAAWTVERTADRARLAVRCLDLPRSARPQVRAEGSGLIGFLAPGLKGTVEFG